MREFDPIPLFRRLTQLNVLCRKYHFAFEVVSDLEGFADALQNPEICRPMICVSDCSSSAATLANSPNLSTVRTVFLYMPHSIQDNWMEERGRALGILREIFTQF